MVSLLCTHGQDCGLSALFLLSLLLTLNDDKELLVRRRKSMRGYVSLYSGCSFDSMYVTQTHFKSQPK